MILQKFKSVRFLSEMDFQSEMYGLLLEFLQPSNDIIRNDDLCDIVVDFLEFGVDLSNVTEATKHGLGYVVDAKTANPEELQDCIKGCLIGCHLELLAVYWCHASQDLKNQMLKFVWGTMRYSDEKTAAFLIEHLIQHGANVNTRFYGGCTFLHYVCGKNGSELIARVLLSNGADVNARSVSQVCIFCFGLNCLE